jgi:hypothetical protein
MENLQFLVRFDKMLWDGPVNEKKVKVSTKIKSLQALLHGFTDSCGASLLSVVPNFAANEKAFPRKPTLLERSPQGGFVSIKGGCIKVTIAGMDGI